MQTELYFQVEVLDDPSRSKGRWSHLARIRLSGDPVLAAILAAVDPEELPIAREVCFEPRGLPADVTELSIEEDALTVEDQAAALGLPSTCSRAHADVFVRDGHSRYINNGYAITHPDFHTFSWLTSTELSSACASYEQFDGPDAPRLRGVLAMLESLSTMGIESRVVFWFTD